MTTVTVISMTLGCTCGLVWKLVDMVRESNKELERIRHVLIDIKLKL